MINFICVHCKNKLLEEVGDFVCQECDYRLHFDLGVWRSSMVEIEKDKQFYEDIYQSEKGRSWFKGLDRNIFKIILEKLSITYIRERFFKKWLKGKNNLILDLACGAGRKYFSNFGQVVGVDLSFAALRVAKERYFLTMQSGVSTLPFADNTFDYVVNSDFFGHVRAEDKDKIINEIKRVLKPGGLAISVIETDSNNYWFRFAHKHPLLFKKYFIDQIGGHVGLELPSICVKRWHGGGFKIISAKKIWGLIWPIRDYWYLFGDEYCRQSLFIRIVVLFSKMLSQYKLIEVAVNIVLAPLNWLAEIFFDLDNGQGLMLVVKK